MIAGRRRRRDGREGGDPARNGNSGSTRLGREGEEVRAERRGVGEKRQRSEGGKDGARARKEEEEEGDTGRKAARGWLGRPASSAVAAIADA